MISNTLPTSEWKEGNRAFYWRDVKLKRNKYLKHPLCLQSKQYNEGMKGVTWVYYSEKDAKRLLKFLKNIFE